MIRLQEPSLCINSHDVPGPRYKMWKTIEVPAGTSASAVVGMISSVNATSVGQGNRGLRNLVINCHGSPGWLGIGTGFDISNVTLFAPLKPMNIGPIWLVACRAALAAAGIAFCQALAKTASTLVIASDDYQSVGVWGSIRYYTTPISGLIDEYEGVVSLFYADGGVARDIDPEEEVQSVMV